MHRVTNALDGVLGCRVLLFGRWLLWNRLEPLLDDFLILSRFRALVLPRGMPTAIGHVLTPPCGCRR